MSDESTRSDRPASLSDLAAILDQRLRKAEAVRWAGDQLHASVSAFHVVDDETVVVTVGKAEWSAFLQSLGGRIK